MYPHFVWNHTQCRLIGQLAHARVSTANNNREAVLNQFLYTRYGVFTLKEGCGKLQLVTEAVRQI